MTNSLSPYYRSRAPFLGARRGPQPQELDQASALDQPTENPSTPPPPSDPAPAAPQRSLPEAAGQYQEDVRGQNAPHNAYGVNDDHDPVPDSRKAEMLNRIPQILLGPAAESRPPVAAPAEPTLPDRPPVTTSGPSLFPAPRPNTAAIAETTPTNLTKDAWNDARVRLGQHHALLTDPAATPQARAVAKQAIDKIHSQLGQALQPASKSEEEAVGVEGEIASPSDGYRGPFRPKDNAAPDLSQPGENLHDMLDQQSRTSLSDIAFRIGDLPFRVIGGVAAGGNPVVQYEYQKSPFTPLNWIFHYDSPPTAEQAQKWTDAQISFNDALEAGLVAQNSGTLRPAQPVAIKLRPVKGDGTPGLAFVLEPGQKDPSKSSDRYQLEIPTTSDIETRRTWVPALGYKNKSSLGFNFVRFDGVNQRQYLVFDRKWNTTNHSDQKQDIKRQIQALEQNPDWTLVVEVPNEQVHKQAMATYDKALREMKLPGQPRIRIEVVEPGSRSSDQYDSIPLETMPSPPIRQIQPLPPGTPEMRAAPQHTLR